MTWKWMIEYLKTMDEIQVNSIVEVPRIKKEEKLSYKGLSAVH